MTPEKISTAAFRLKPGEDLRAGIEKIVRGKDIRAGWVATCSGSLTDYAIRFANQPDASAGSGHFEIVSLSRYSKCEWLAPAPEYQRQHRPNHWRTPDTPVARFIQQPKSFSCIRINIRSPAKRTAPPPGKNSRSGRTTDHNLFSVNAVANLYSAKDLPLPAGRLSD
jgi:hypothetical protein